MSEPEHHEIVIRPTVTTDIPKIVNLQKESYPYLAKYGNVWHESELESQLRIFPEGQCVADLNGEIVGSATSLIVMLLPEYKEHTWKEITSDGMITTHDPKGDSLYGADISTHPKYRHEHIGKRLYDFRKQVVKNFNLRRMISGGRLFNYCEYRDKMSPLEYAQRVIRGEMRDPVLSFEIENEFKFIKILPNYLDDVRSLNYASFIEWINPNYSPKKEL
jgi:Acetyltransferase (GNAT) family